MIHASCFSSSVANKISTFMENKKLNFVAVLPFLSAVLFWRIELTEKSPKYQVTFFYLIVVLLYKSKIQLNLKCLPLIVS